MLIRKAIGSLAALLFLVPAARAAETDYPTRPITLIVPFAAGGASDVIARLAAEGMGQALGQRLINENIPGAGGSTALTRAARATPDGYTLVIGNAGTNAAAYTLYNDLKYTPDAFAPVGLVAKTSPVIAIKKDFAAATLAEFIAYAKANPGKVSLGHAGVGSSNYLICKSFLHAAKIDVTLVSYRGGALALNDLVGGQIDGVCDAATSITPAIQSGQVKGLVVSSPSRLPTLPDVPASAEAGLPEFKAQGWNAIFAPKGTPEPIIAKLNAALGKALKGELLLKRMEELGSFPPEGNEASPDYLKDFVPNEIAKYRQLLADAP